MSIEVGAKLSEKFQELQICAFVDLGIRKQD